jgi:membrane associated rhomboid family serine protease
VANGYSRGGALGGALTEGVKYLLIWNAIFFLLQRFIWGDGVAALHAIHVITVRMQGGLVPVPYEVGSLETLLGIVPALVWQKGFLWQIVSYMFLHGGFFHILLNMFALWMFGSDLERVWGTRRFLVYYFFTGIGAGIMTVLVTPHGYVPTIGASGAIYGILLAYALFFPERRVLLYFFIPIPVRVFVLIFGVIELLGAITLPGDSIAHVAHLGGLVFGWIFLRWRVPNSLWQRWTWRRRRKHLRVVDFTREDPPDRWRSGG